MGALGYGYKIGREDIPAYGGSMDQQSAPSIGENMPALDGELQQVSNLTRQYYDKWFQMQNFAKAMHSNYGIDVTSPDFTSPTNMEANNVFMQGMADLYNQGNALKRGAKMENMYTNVAAQSPNITYQSTGPEGQIQGQQTLEDTRATAPLQRAQSIAIAYSTQAETDAANEELQALKDDAMRRAEDIVKTGDVQAIMNHAEQVKELEALKATYSSLDQQRINVARQRALDSGKKDLKTGRLNEVRWAKLGDLSKIKNRTNYEGNALHKYILYNPYDGTIKYRPNKDGAKSQYYNPEDDPNGTVANELFFNVGSNDKDVSGDELKNKGKYEVDDFEGNPLIEELDMYGKEWNQTVFVPAVNSFIDVVTDEPALINNLTNELKTMSRTQGFDLPPGGDAIRQAQVINPEEDYVSQGGEDITNISFDEGWGGVFGIGKRAPVLVIDIKHPEDGKKREIKLDLNAPEDLDYFNKIIIKNAGVFHQGNLLNNMLLNVGFKPTEIGSYGEDARNGYMTERYLEAHPQEDN